MASATQQRRADRQQEQDPIALMEQTIAETERNATLIEKIVDKCAFGSLVDVGHVHRSTRLACGIRALRDLLTDDFMNDVIMPLMNSPLGFATDKAKEGGYPVNVVRDCYIDALINGAYATGNEWGIISGRCYLQQSHFVRKLHSIPGIANVVMSPGMPVVRDGKTVVRFGISWVYRGEPGQLLDQEGKPGQVFVIKVNAGMGDDAVIGKAKRKACKAACEQIMGISLGADEDEHTEAVTKPRTLDDLKPVTRDDVKPADPSPGELVDPETLEEIEQSCRMLKFNGVRLESHLKTTYGVLTTSALTPDMAVDFRSHLDWMLEQEPTE